MTDEIDNAIKLNKIYDEKGFKGLINFVKHELKYGTVTFKNELYCITTGGWSEDEFLVHSLISPISKMHYHYCGYLIGGAFYFTEDKNTSAVKMIKTLFDDNMIGERPLRFQLPKNKKPKYFEDHEETYADGTPEKYYFNNHEDFCNIVTKLNEIDNTSKGKTDFIIYQHDIIKDLKKENQGLKLEIHYIHTTITDSIKTERTELGKAVLKALKKRIQYETKK